MSTTPPAESQVSPGSEISIWIATPIMIRVPELVGLDYPIAMRKIKAAGLVEGTLSQSSSDIEAGTVLRQNPAPGTAVPPNSPVMLSVSVARTPVWFWPGITFLGLITAAGAVLLIRKVMIREHPEGELANLPGLEITPHVDTGTPRLSSGQSPDFDLEISLHPVDDPGLQDATPSSCLIESEEYKP